jgi:hypothetical protein
VLRKKIAVLFAAAMMMVVMLAMSAAPAFAKWEADGCRSGSLLIPATDEFEANKDRNNNGLVCFHLGARVHIYDDHPRT